MGSTSHHRKLAMVVTAEISANLGGLKCYRNFRVICNSVRRGALNHLRDIAIEYIVHLLDYCAHRNYPTGPPTRAVGSSVGSSVFKLSIFPITTSQRCYKDQLVKRLQKANAATHMFLPK